VIVAIHHVQLSIPVGGSRSAREFYCDFLGLSEVPRPGTATDRAGFWMRQGQFEIHVAEEDGIDRERTRAHVAYEVDDLEDWRARLAARGIGVHDGRPVPGVIRLDFRDPFGNRIELVQRRA
jgi:catechol 2,3-dioxygenase-like lactoylglutathione lyase family enzyme